MYIPVNIDDLHENLSIYDSGYWTHEDICTLRDACNDRGYGWDIGIRDLFWVNIPESLQDHVLSLEFQRREAKAFRLGATNLEEEKEEEMEEEFA
jgi:hypothetical protein